MKKSENKKPKKVKKTAKVVKKVKKKVTRKKVTTIKAAKPAGRPRGRPRKQKLVTPKVIGKKTTVTKVAPSAPPAPKTVVKKEIGPPRPKVRVNELTTLRELSEKINKPAPELLKKLLSLGILGTINQRLDSDTMELIAHEFGYEIDFISLYSDEKLKIEEDTTAQLLTRAPVVTVMGHVDHGKTLLLDAIRKTKVVETEAGNITQHIGAYKVETPKGSIVFLDTPGHEAFTAMRAHGSKITDIVVLVIAADDGIMPQTVEAIDHARAAGVPIIVAINKIDLPNANSQKIKQQLSQYNLLPDDWGGDTFVVEISARDKINIDKLLEIILFKTELMELKANPDRPAQGVIIETKLDQRKGNVTTVLIQKGTLKISDKFICGLAYGKVRAMINDRSNRIISAGPSTSVEILGFSKMPLVGENFVVVKDEKTAKEIIEKRHSIVYQEKLLTQKKHVSLDTLKNAKIKQLNIILKTDVQGSLDAVRDSLERLNTEEIKLNMLHSGVGAINESDVNLATTSNAVIIGFNIRPDVNSETLAKQEGVDIRIYRVIFKLVDDLKRALEGLLEPEVKETITGRAEVKKTFSIDGTGNVAGCIIVQGKATSQSRIRLLRDNVIIHESRVSSLRRFKNDVKEVEKGHECGICLENYNDIKINDILEIYIQEKVKK